ncbi:MAG: hypothetical protein ABFD10_05250 [Prolixibacteraceae bacterium]
MRKTLLKALLLVFVAGFVACNDDDPEPQGGGDAYIISKGSLQERKVGNQLSFMDCILMVGPFTVLFHQLK